MALDLTPGFRLYAKHRARRLEATDVPHAQRSVLRGLVERAAATRFGRDHGFRGIDGVEAFQRQVPIRDHAAFWREYWGEPFPILDDCTWPGRIPAFALTSGTTSGVTRYVPHSRAMGAAGTRGMLDLFVHHVRRRPDSRFLGGMGLMLGGSPRLRQLAPGVAAGELSGLAARDASWWLRRRLLPQGAVAAIDDWAEKMERLAPITLEQDVRVLGGAPNWLLLFLERLAELRPDDERCLASWFPNLEVVVHGGIGFTPYRRPFRELLSGSHAETREAYSASEAFIAAADRGDGEGLRVVADNDVFFEFVPTGELASPSPTRHWLGNVELEEEYAILVTTSAGVWAYQLGDTVRFVDRDPPRLLVTGRTAYVLSALGERLVDEEISAAVAGAAEAISSAVTDFSVSPVLPSGGSSGVSGGHRYVVECDRIVDAADRGEFARMLDDRLCRLNDGYRTRRRRESGLSAPVVQFVDPGTFAAWMKGRNQLGGQHKVPRVINDPELRDELQRFVAANGADVP